MESDLPTMLDATRRPVSTNWLIALVLVLLGLTVGADRSSIAQATGRHFVIAAEAGSSTTILGENMAAHVQPFADATGSRTLGFGTSSERWNAMSPAQRWKLNDGQLRARVDEGDSFRYIGQDLERSPLVRQQFDLTRSELLRLDERGIPYDLVSPDEVFKTIGRW